MKDLTPLQKSVLVLLPDNEFKISDVNKEAEKKGIFTPKAIQKRFQDVMGAFIIKGLLIQYRCKDPGHHLKTYELTIEGKKKKKEQEL